MINQIRLAGAWPAPMAAGHLGHSRESTSNASAPALMRS
jgi:hypothetical protein